ncbi:hypothetical protein CBM2597_A150021 [Cupriavidus taiwanensis]|uniref:Uncharacterized protein n=1 Tax=Cupriavidus taiwanensis TaxID=164546 RepID=A0A7Z7J759_9BURK|nr:hypothetical protein CBM2597_A150021 [Cupriavidus taiwanensis]SPC07818.1 hypothetical protein CBM2594_A130021 [Cupriavidus taiwanensis]
MHLGCKLFLAQACYGSGSPKGSGAFCDLQQTFLRPVQGPPIKES